MTVRSDDYGRTWSAPRALVAGAEIARGPVRTKICVLDSGAWLAGGSVERGWRWDAFADLSWDCGRTWSLAAVPLRHQHNTGVDAVGRPWNGLSAGSLWETDVAVVRSWDGVIQPTVWQSAHNHVHMLLRSSRGWIYRSDSTDGGVTWCEAYQTPLPNNNSGIDAIRLRDGRLALAYNPVAGNWAQRTPLAIAVSGDNGKSWSSDLIIEAGLHELSYPALVATQNSCAISYTRDRRSLVYSEIDSL